jgi:hypothetical protein
MHGATMKFINALSTAEIIDDRMITTGELHA